MSLDVKTYWEIQNGGSDTANGGGFNHTNSSMATDLSATSGTGSSPVVTSASYNFVAGDVGHWLFIKSGTNWTPGWYKIASVAANAATLTAGINTVPLYENKGMNTVIGCATVASPTSGTWSIDYSQTTSARFTYTDLTASGAGSTFTSAGNPFGKNCVGNILQITSGTNCTTGWFEVSSISGTTATFDRSVTTGATSNGAGGLGGALATPGQAFAIRGSGDARGNLFVKYNATAYTLSSTANIAGGRLSVGGNWPCIMTGYDTTRHRWNNDTNWPIFDAGAASIVMVSLDGADNWFRNFTFTNSASRTGIDGLKINGTRDFCQNVSMDKATNSYGISIEGDGLLHNFKITNCGSTTNALQLRGDGSTAHTGSLISNLGKGADLSVTGGIGTVKNIICKSNTGVCFNTAGYLNIVENCVAYGGSSDGFTGVGSSFLLNCISYNNTRDDYNYSSVTNVIFINCAGGGSASNFPSNTYIFSGPVQGFIQLTANPFTNASGNDFSLNNTAGGGTLLKGKGFPQTSGFYGLSTNSYPDVGAVQSQATAAGSVIFNSSLSGVE